jgi:hypothetical protein
MVVHFLLALPISITHLTHRVFYRTPWLPLRIRKGGTDVLIGGAGGEVLRNVSQ